MAEAVEGGQYQRLVEPNFHKKRHVPHGLAHSDIMAFALAGVWMAKAYLKTQKPTSNAQNIFKRIHKYAEQLVEAAKAKGLAVDDKEPVLLV
jgi:hypothetical protein